MTVDVPENTRPHHPPRLLRAAAIALAGLLLGHAEADHVWPYLDVDPAVIQKAFSIAL